MRPRDRPVAKNETKEGVSLIEGWLSYLIPRLRGASLLARLIDIIRSSWITFGRQHRSHDAPRCNCGLSSGLFLPLPPPPPPRIYLAPRFVGRAIRSSLQIEHRLIIALFAKLFLILSTDNLLGDNDRARKKVLSSVLNQFEFWVIEVVLRMHE